MEYWTELPALYRRSLLVICFQYCVYTSTPRSWFCLQHCLVSIESVLERILMGRIESSKGLDCACLFSPYIDPGVFLLLGLRQILLISTAVLTLICRAFSWGPAGRWGSSCSEIQQCSIALLFSCTEANTYKASRSCLFLSHCILKFMGILWHLVLLDCEFFHLTFEFCFYWGI